MNKNRIEFERIESLKGYAKINDEWRSSPNCQEILDFLLDWSNLEENKNKKIYRHNIVRVEENFQDRYQYFKYSNMIEKKDFEGDKNGKAYRIPYCDLVFYIDIYWQ